MKQAGNKEMPLWQRITEKRWSLIAMAIAFCVSIPILTIVFKLIDGPGETWQHIVDNLLGEYLLHTLYLSIGCTLVTLLFGVSAAWLVVRYDFPLRKYLEWGLILPLAIPAYMMAYAYAGLFDYSGVVEGILHALGIVEGPYRVDIMNIYGVILVLSVSLYPYIYVSARTVLLYQSSHLIEAAQTLGVGRWQEFWRVALPMARPAIAVGVALVLMEVLNDYGAVHYYGVSTFTTAIFRSWFSLGEPATAVYLAALLCVFIFLLLFLERWQRRNKSYAVQSKSNTPLRRIPLKGGAAFVALSVVALPVVLGFVFPVYQLLYWAYLTATDVWQGDFWVTVFQSAYIALVAAFLVTVLAVVLIYGGRWSRLKWIKYVMPVATMGYAVPGAIIAIGVVIATLFVDKGWVYWAEQLWGVKMGFLFNGTLLVLWYGYIVRFLAVAYNPLQANVEKIGRDIDEAAQILGARPSRNLWQIQLPLLKTGLWSALLLVFVDVMKELPLTLMLKPYDVMTLSTKAYEYASDERIAEAALPCLIVIILGLIPVLVLNRVMK